MKQLDATGLKRLHRSWRQRTTGRVGLILDSVQTPYNVGAILRTAAAYRVDDVWLAGHTAPAASPGARKTALGTDRFLTLITAPTALDAVQLARAAGYHVVAVELTDDAKPLHDLALGTATCLVVGHEDHGVSATALAACDEAAYLPLAGKVGSLNVATAAAIALYEVRRREWEHEG
jgi:tRNA (guanosine-2'-O-)-methyltransferase